MSFECRDLGHVLGGEDTERMAALEAHALACPDCRQELALYREIQAAAPQLRRDWPSPELWPRIQMSLEAESATRTHRPRHFRWMPVAAVALVALGVSVFLRRGTEIPATEKAESEQRLLTEKAVEDVEDAEAAYVRSIEALSRVVEPRLRRADSPLLMNYREKLELLDAAIADCRAQIESNRFHAGLRHELIEVYREKQKTLEQVMKEKGNGES